MKKVFVMLTAFCVMLSFLTGCDNASNGCKSTENGLKYSFVKKSHRGNLPQIGDIIEFRWACTLNDTLTLIPSTEEMIKLAEPTFKSDIMEGFAMMHIGDSALFFADVETVFVKMFGYPRVPGDIDSTSVIRFDVRMNDFYPESEFENKMKEKGEKAIAILKKYIEDNNILAEPTESGLYYVQISEGNGEKPAQGANVKVHYTGKLLNGEVFDSSIERGEPIDIPIGVGRVIPGWDEGIMMMSKGEKGVLYIPYNLAYGERGAGGVIPPFANLIFEVELVDFE